MMQAPKRRRVEPIGGDHATSGNPAYDEAQYLRHLPPYGNGDHVVVDPSSDFSLEVSPVTVTAHASGSTATLASSMPSSMWDAQPYSDTYPDAAAVFTPQQNPYFAGYGQSSTDSTTHNSPWPPQQAPTEDIGQEGGFGAGASAAMSYYGSNDSGIMDSDGGFGGNIATSMQSYGEDVEMSTDYSYRPADRGVQAMGVVPAESSAMDFDDASMQLKNQSLPILENLATQLIQTTSRASLAQIQQIMNGSDTGEGQAYTALKSLFEQTRKVYSRESPFIDAIAIQMFRPSQQETVRKANIATFIASILGAHDVSFFHLNEFFMETFVPLGHRLLKWQSAIFLELKTQAYISALINSDGCPSAMLDELFPPDLDAQILTRHPDAPSLSPSEQDFLERCRARKSYLLAEGNALTALKELPRKYQWSEFVREFASCISKNVETIMNAPVRQNPTVDRKNTLNGDAGLLHLNAVAANAVIADTANSAAPGPALGNPTNPKSNPTASSTQSSTVTAPTAPSTVRQPWTKPEEDALLSGLLQVSGPHWSQILALYGPGGSISEVLKDRNQVQLKDKARNLKLWYLKMGREVPSSLRGVTGELQKRGGKGARAALGIEDGDDGKGESEGGREKSGTKAGGRGKKQTKKGS